MMRPAALRALLTPVFVPYESPLQRGVLLDRRDRFIASVRLDGEGADVSVDAHCLNPVRHCWSGSRTSGPSSNLSPTCRYSRAASLMPVCRRAGTDGGIC